MVFSSACPLCLRSCSLSPPCCSHSIFEKKRKRRPRERSAAPSYWESQFVPCTTPLWPPRASGPRRSEEHTSELQSHLNLVCRLLLEKKNKWTSGSSMIRLACL